MRTVRPDIGSRPTRIVLTLAVVALSLGSATAETLDATYRHELGFFFAHPSGWSLQEAMPGVLAFVPTDIEMHQGQPAEVLLILGEDAGGITDPSDARVVAMAEQGIAGLLPFLQRTGATETLELGGRTTARLDWAGDSPTGLHAEGTMWVTMLEGAMLAVFGVGSDGRMATRRPTLEAIVASIGYEKPAAPVASASAGSVEDPRVVGHWRYTDTYMSGDFSMVDERHLFLRPDGTFSETGEMMGGMQHSDDSGSYTGDTSVSNTGMQNSGRWYTKDKVITLEWSDGSVETWPYLITATDMMFKGSSSNKLWTRIE